MRVIEAVELCDDKIQKVELGALITRKLKRTRQGDYIYLYIGGSLVGAIKQEQSHRQQWMCLLSINPRTTGTGRYAGWNLQQLPVPLLDAACGIAMSSFNHCTNTMSKEVTISYPIYYHANRATGMIEASPSANRDGKVWHKTKEAALAAT